MMHIRDTFMEITWLLIPRMQKAKYTQGYFVNKFTKLRIFKYFIG